MKQERNRPSVYPSIARRIIALALALWLAAMGLLTWAVAVDFVRQLEASNNYYWLSYSSADYADKAPGKMTYDMIRNLGSGYYFLSAEPLLPIVRGQRPSSIGNNDWYWGMWDMLFGYEIAVSFRDGNGTRAISSGNYIAFGYVSEEGFRAEEGTSQGYGYLDLDTLPGFPVTSDGWSSNFPAGDMGFDMIYGNLRFTGWFEEDQFHPVTVDRGWYQHHPDWEDNLVTLSQLEKRGLVEWQRLWEQEAPTGRELVTIYAHDFWAIYYESEPVTVGGVEYADLRALLDAYTADRQHYGAYANDSLLETVFFHTAYAEGNEYIHTTAVRCWPLGYAVLRMFPAYLGSLALVGLAVYLILRRIKRNLDLPLHRLEKAIAYGSTVFPCAAWEEIYTLEAHHAKTHQALSEANTQLQQLRTALDYAENAEENRRKLVSGITHELKTPLSVIHSYAEGLQAGIAGEKREQYLAVILEETEKMDAMVLQMLDLSRLEAGKVRLASDLFSLAKLTQDIAEKFAPLLEAKGLQLHYDLVQELYITADESRIAQVITNLLSNALKYTPEGGQLRLSIFAMKQEVCLRVENTSPPLSAEALEKVWDSFYRADPSRSEPGTGLGLTLVKAIVDLHQGRCSVRNTVKDGESYVSFSIILPR